jgi:hypothetical protein
VGGCSAEADLLWYDYKHGHHQELAGIRDHEATTDDLDRADNKQARSCKMRTPWSPTRSRRSGSSCAWSQRYIFATNRPQTLKL